MKILWFTNTPSLYDQGKHSYHGGGWIESLQALLENEPSIELAIAFFHISASLKEIKGNTTYYPIYKKRARRNPLKSVIRNYRGLVENEQKIMPKLQNIITDFKPDVIHVFGTEGVFSGIQKHTKVPIVIHLQGLINPYLNAYYPPSTSKLSFFFNISYFVRNLLGSSPYFGENKMKNLALREQENMENVKFVMGRTKWDKTFTELYAPKARYFHVNEVLRDVFYKNKVNYESCNKSITIVSTISPTIYKGIDVILKTAKLCSEKLGLDVTWKLAGLNNYDKLLKYYENNLGIDHKDYGIECLGSLDSRTLLKILNDSNLFIHPSYIDNSPNSVCEAQLIGLPVVACNVGGLSTLIEHRKTGILVPSNGVVELVACIKEFSDNPEAYNEIAKNARIEAQKRHDKTSIINGLKEVYSTIINS